jgi:hypothetical protein
VGQKPAPGMDDETPSDPDLSTGVVQIQGGHATPSAMTRSIVVGALWVIGCDVGRPVLEDVDPEQVEMFEEACVTLESCCEMDVPRCLDGFVDQADRKAHQHRRAVSLGIEATRDDACPMMSMDVQEPTGCAMEGACAPPCKPFVGSVGAGGECHRSGSIDDCAQGLLCFAAAGGASTRVDVGVCANPCDRVGQPCDAEPELFPDDGSALYLRTKSNPCGPLAFCGDDGLCASARLEGEACESSIECLYGFECDPGTRTCAREWSSSMADPPVCCEWLIEYGY